MVNIQSLTSIHADGPVVTDEFLMYVDYVDLVMFLMYPYVCRLCRSCYVSRLQGSQYSFRHLDTYIQHQPYPNGLNGMHL